MPEPDEGMAVARIVIERRLYDNPDYPDQISFETINPCTGDEIGLIEILGLLRLAEHTAIGSAASVDEETDPDDRV